MNVAELVSEGTWPIPKGADFIGVGRSRFYQLLAPPGQAPTEQRPIATVQVGRRRLVLVASLKTYLASLLTEESAA